MMYYRDLYKKVAKKLDMPEEQVAFIIEDFFKGLKRVVKEELFVRFWKGVRFKPFVIVTSPKYLLVKSRFEKYLWYIKHKKAWNEKANHNVQYKSFKVENYPHLEKRLNEYLQHKELFNFAKAMNNISSEYKEELNKQRKKDGLYQDTLDSVFRKHLKNK